MGDVTLIHAPKREEYAEQRGVVTVVLGFRHRVRVLDAIAWAQDRLRTSGDLDWTRVQAFEKSRPREYEVRLWIPSVAAVPPTAGDGAPSSDSTRARGHLGGGR